MNGLKYIHDLCTLSHHLIAAFDLSKKESLTAGTESLCQGNCDEPYTSKGNGTFLL